MSNTPPPDPSAQPSPDPSVQPPADPSAQPGQWAQSDPWSLPQPGQPGRWAQPDPWGQPQPVQQQPGDWVPQPGAWGQQQPGAWGQQQPGAWGQQQPGAWPPGQPGQAYPPQYPPLSAIPGGIRFDPADPLVSNDYAGWWRRGTAVVKAGWKSLALLQLLTSAPMVLLMLVVQISTGIATGDTFEAAWFGDDTNAALAIAAVGAVLLGLVIAFAWYVVGTLATVRMVVTVATGGKPRIRESLTSVLPRVPAMFVWYLVAGLLSLAAVLACFLPVFYVAAVVTILPAVVLFERGVGIGRCFQLFHGDLGAAVGRAATILGLYITGAVAFGIMKALASAIVLGVSGIDGSLDVGSAAAITGSALEALLDIVYYVLSGIVLTPLTVAMYADLRARREPFSTAYLVNPPV